jgi:2'-5' RNA ligase
MVATNDDVYEEETLSTCIMLVPGKALRDRRPDVFEIHLTLAYLGRFTENDTRLAPVRRTLHNLAKNIGPVYGVANGTAIFPERERFAVADLIDGIEVFYARKMVESLYGRASGAYDSLDVKVDYTHGFTPHITREYVMAEDATPDLLLPTEPVEFQFEAIGLWHGSNHYEVAL